MLLGQAGYAASASLYLVTSFAVTVMSIIAKHPVPPSSVLILAFSLSTYFLGDLIPSMGLLLFLMLNFQLVCCCCFNFGCAGSLCNAWISLVVQRLQNVQAQQLRHVGSLVAHSMCDFSSVTSFITHVLCIGGEFLTTGSPREVPYSHPPITSFYKSSFIETQPDIYLHFVSAAFTLQLQS